ncbi:MAG: hypothetical protein V4613_07615 [Bacteroidota bacterium]
MQRTIIHLTIYFFSIITILLGQNSVGQTVKHPSVQRLINTDTLNVSGKYEALTCFRGNECITTKLFIKQNHTYRKKFISIDHGRKDRSTVHGTWAIEGDILILNKTKTKNDNQPDTVKYKIIKGDLWGFSPVTLEPTGIALKRK